MKLRGKIVGPIVAALVVTSGISFVITEHKVNGQAEEAFIDKVRQITGMANAIRTWNSGHLSSLVPDGKFNNLDQVPVVSAWRVAEDYAKAENMSFRTPALRPRNPKNKPDDFELRALEAFERDPAKLEFYERGTIDGKEVMRYAQAVRLTQDCLTCHGGPAGEMGPFGYPKEGMKAGDLRGAFAVAASTEKLSLNARANFLTLFFGTLIMLLAATGVIWVLIDRFVLRPLAASVSMLKDVAEGDGDLTKRLDVQSEDELGELGQWFNLFISKLQDIIRQVESNTEQLASASEQLSASASQIARSTDTQKSEATQVATAVHEMSVTVHQVSENSERANSNALHAAQLAESGGQVVEGTVTLIREVAETTRGTVQQIEKLGESSQQIGTIIGVIDDIADQTNLLALNAAIEAARAGEQGRGFAVVADEVRKLAERTSKATKEIADMIRTIQGDTATAVDAIRSGAARVDGGVEAASKAGKSLEEIIESSQAMQEVVSHIASATVEQAAAGSQISGSMDHIAKMVEQSSLAANESAKACEDLNTLCVNLRQIVRRFKTGDSRATEWHSAVPSTRSSSFRPSVH